MSDLDLFDPIAYFEDRDIEYHTEGKNVSRGWINISCPFCVDPSWHCGINLESKVFHCWICGEKGPATKLIRQLENCDWKEAETIVGLYKETYDFSQEKTNPIQSILRKKIFSARLDLKETIPELIGNLLPIQRDYLRGRGFDPDLLERKYDLKGVPGIGRYRYRIIAPVFFEGQTVNFVACAIFRDDSTEKYLFCPNEKAVMPIHQVLYNIDMVRDRVVIVEGVTDVWRVGDGAVAILGKMFTQEQIRLLVRKEIRKVLVLLDSDAKEKAEKLAAQISPFIPTEIGFLDEGDPCDLDEKELEKVRMWLKE